MTNERDQRLLTEIRLTNFKSVKDERVQLGPLTIVIGANSSGKSTLMQGLLLLTQTIESGNTEASVPLNGERVNLGFLSKVRNSTSPAADPIRVGVSAQFPSGGQRGLLYYGGYYSEVPDVDAGSWIAEYDVEFSGASRAEVVAPEVKTIHLCARRRGADEPELVLALRRNSGRTGLEKAEVIGQRFGPYADLRRHMVGSVVAAGQRSSRVVAVAMNGLLPVALAERKVEHAALADAFLNHLMHFPVDFVDDSAFESPEAARDVETVLDMAASTLAEWRDGPDDRPHLDRFLRDKLAAREIPWSAIQAVFERRTDFISRLGRRLAPSSNRRLDVPIRGRAAELVALSSQGVRDTVASIEHLGGLRAAPQPLYPTSNQAQRGYLGRDGEYTAAVLYALRDRIVPSFDENGVLESVSLQDAVKAWAARLGLFEEVAPHHRGALGMDITVRQAGVETDVDITAVGLGVSQLLPVLVRCLLSKPQDVVLLEQPELHLHPESQQKLADFLLACSRSGRQLIVETHSEHLVNRLRLHAARDESSTVADMITLVFAERDAAEGSTRYRNVAVNPYGGLSEWPSGFMAEGIQDAKALLESGLEKLRSAERS